jgi:protein-S-isoprenylcysteine O-methyltransferase Ste14
MTAQDQKSATTIQKWWLEIIITLLFLGVVLFATSGKFTWVMAWVYLAIVLLIKVENTVTIDASLMEERAQPKEGTKKWDIILAGFVAVVGPLITLIAAGLDARFGWSHKMGLTVLIVATIFVALGGLLVNWAMATNQFFSSTVRIQSDRNHTVSTQGPYQYVRHPGYVRAIIGIMMTPFMLESWMAFIPASAQAGQPLRSFCTILNLLNANGRHRFRYQISRIRTLFVQYLPNLLSTARLVDC